MSARPARNSMRFNGLVNVAETCSAGTFDKRVDSSSSIFHNPQSACYEGYVRSTGILTFWFGWKIPALAKYWPRPSSLIDKLLFFIKFLKGRIFNSFDTDDTGTNQTYPCINRPQRRRVHIATGVRVFRV